VKIQIMDGKQNIVGRCQQTFENKKNDYFALITQVNSPANNLNFY
jgi:hypothetical protein